MWDLENLNESAKFYFDDDKTNWVVLQIASDKQINKMRKEAGISQKVEYLKNFKTGKQERSDYLNTTEDNMEKLNELINDFAIVDWCLINKDGSNIPCTTEMKNKMMGESVKFSTFVADKLEFIRESQASSKEAETKN